MKIYYSELKNLIAIHFKNNLIETYVMDDVRVCYLLTNEWIEIGNL